MTELKRFFAEVDHNATAFEAAVADDLAKAASALASSSELVTSYRHIASLQAWRAYLWEELLSTRARGFFLESQNDVLVAHVLAGRGVSRPALQCLRGCIENAMAGIFYKDHPVELQLWSSGTHRLSSRELFEYLLRHPDLTGKRVAEKGLQMLKREYRTLSKAVHASAAEFRMTVKGDSTLVVSHDVVAFRRWATHARRVIVSLNQIYLCLFADKVSGAQRAPIRVAVSAVLTERQKAHVRSELGIVLFEDSRGK